MLSGHPRECSCGVESSRRKGYLKALGAPQMAEWGKAEMRGDGKGKLLLLCFTSEVPRKVRSADR